MRAKTRASTRAGVLAALAPLVVPVLHQLYEGERQLIGFDVGPVVTWGGIPSAVALLAGASCLRRHPRFGRALVGFGAAAFGVLGAVGAAESPLAALLVIMLALGGATWVLTADLGDPRRGIASAKHGVVARARGSASAALAAILLVLSFELVTDALTHVAAVAPAVVAVGFALARLESSRLRRILAVVLTGTAALVLWTWSSPTLSLLAACTVPGALLLLLPAEDDDAARITAGWQDALLERPARLLVLSFVIAGVVGTLFLTLPVSSSAAPLHVVDALFTAFSALCVTGLIVLDTPVDFSLFGQGVILALIQLGGLGIMTFSTAAFVLFGRRMSVRGEAAAVRLLGAEDLSALGSALRRMIVVTAVTEVAGALLLFAAFRVEGDSWGPALYRGVFTSISAYCNAGFALQSDSLVPYAESSFVLLVVSAIIVVGGLGPVVVVAVPQWLRGRRVSTHVRMVLGLTPWLLFGPAVLIAALEWSNTLGELGLGHRVLNAWFQSVTTRTAGFNSVDFGAMNHTTIALVWALMFVGGSPGSTAGGIKTTTLAVLFLSIRTVAREADELTLGSRRIHQRALLQALAVVAAAAIVILVGIVVLGMTQRIETVPLVFEVVSAVGTVGLSMGVTADLDAVGRVIVTVLMLVGRVGPLALVAVALPRPDIDPQEFPEDRVPIG